MTSPELPAFRTNRFLQLILGAYTAVWLATAIAPRDWPTWLLENLLVVVAVGVLAVTWRPFAFSNLSYLLIALFLSLHAIGAHSGYMHTPGRRFAPRRARAAAQSIRSGHSLRVPAAAGVSVAQAFDPHW